MAQPTVRPLPSPILDGLVMTIQGQTAPNCDKFSVNVACGGGNIGSSDILLHCDTRFATNQVVRNTYKNGAWEGEEQGPAPIQKGGPFEIIILVSNDKYMVSYNGKHYCEFKHRMPKERATHLIVHGQGVTVTNIMMGGPGAGGAMGASTMGPGYAPPPYTPAGSYAFAGGQQPGGYPGAQPGGYPGAAQPMAGGYPGTQPGGSPAAH